MPLDGRGGALRGLGDYAVQPARTPREYNTFMPRRLRPRTSLQDHRRALPKNIGALLYTADRLNAEAGPRVSGLAIALARAGVWDALEQWTRLQDHGLAGDAKRQALADINEDLERRRRQMDRILADR